MYTRAQRRRSDCRAASRKARRSVSESISLPRCVSSSSAPLARRVLACCERTVDHELSLGANLVLGIALQECTARDCGDACPNRECCDQRQIDPKQQIHAIPSIESVGRASAVQPGGRHCGEATPPAQ